MSLMLLWCDVSLQLFPMIMTLLCHMILLIYASAENWKDSNGRDMAPGRFWNSGIETTISADDSGPCMGIELNIWEQAKVHPFQLKYIYTYYVSFKFVYYHDIHYGVDFHCIL